MQRTSLYQDNSTLNYNCSFLCVHHEMQFLNIQIRIEKESSIKINEERYNHVVPLFISGKKNVNDELVLTNRITYKQSDFNKNKSFK